MRSVLAKIGLWGVILVILLTVISIVFTPSSVWGTSAMRVVRAPFVFARAIFQVPKFRDINALMRENEELRGQITFLKLQAHEGEGNEKRIIARVYSSYPFNNQALLTINAGSIHGVEKKMPVTVGDALLLGQVVEVYEKKSVVRTIFNPGWQLPVKIGEGSVDALLEGNRVPQLSLIVGEGEVQDGDPVYIAQKDFPFGLTIGELIHLRESSDRTVKKAEVQIPFSPSEVNEVQVWLK